MVAKITTGSSFGINAKQATAARLLAEGNTEDAVLLALYGGPLTPQEKTKYKRALHKWMALKGFAECYRGVVREIAMPSYGRAVRRITAQIDDDNPWVALGAAREVLARFGAAIMGDEDKEIVVRVEGLPTLGIPPEDDESTHNA